jgi:hypothetical protein
MELISEGSHGSIGTPGVSLREAAWGCRGGLEVLGGAAAGGSGCRLSAWRVWRMASCKEGEGQISYNQCCSLSDIHTEMRITCLRRGTSNKCFDSMCSHYSRKSLHSVKTTQLLGSQSSYVKQSSLINSME